MLHDAWICKKLNVKRSLPVGLGAAFCHINFVVIVLVMRAAMRV